MRVVLDTNIWLSGLVYSEQLSPPRLILEHLTQGNFELIISSELVEEFNEVLGRHNLSKSIMQKWLRVLKRAHLNKPPYVRHAKPASKIDVIENDPDDNRVLECAIAGKADFIVSGDKHLLNLSKYQNVVILSPRDFVEQLKEES